MLPPYDDLRSFLKVLDREGQFLRISRPVNLEPDLGAARRAVANRDTADRLQALFEEAAAVTWPLEATTRR